MKKPRKKETFHEVNAVSYKELGRQLADKFGDEINALLDVLIRDYEIDDHSYERIAKREIERARTYLPNVVDQLEGCAEELRRDASHLWWLAIGYDFENVYKNHCTTVITDGGLMIGHNEDDELSSKDYLYVVKKTVGKLTMLELFYADGLGGNSISVNSNGFVHSVNSLPFAREREGLPREREGLPREREGLPRDFIARWMSEINEVGPYYEQLKKMPRLSAYSHNIVSSDGKNFNIESDKGKKPDCWKRESPCCHTNHYLGEKPQCPNGDNLSGSKQRYKKACELLKQGKTVKEILTNEEGVDDGKIFNEGTIGSMIVDLRDRKAHIWLRREGMSDWTTYDLSFIR